MKALILSLVALTFPLAALESTKPPTWKVVVNDNEEFPRTYVFRACVLSPRADGTGVAARAYDVSDKGMHTLQAITIIAGSAGYLHVEKGYYLSQFGTDDVAVLIPIKEMGDIFQEACAEAARELPIEAQRAFFGQYGLGKPKRK